MITIELFRLFGSIAIDDNQARRSLQNIDSQAENTSGRVGGFFSKAGQAMGAAVVAGAAAAGAGLVVLTGVIGKTGIAYNSMIENSKVAWTTLLGTEEEAKNMLEEIADFAKTTQFETGQVDMMAKYMHNAGLAGKELFDELTKVADISGAFNIPAAEAQELARQMSQVRQAGLAYTEDLNVLQDRGIPIYKAIAQQLGITVADVKKMASEGKLTSDIYLKAFDNIAKGVEGSAAKQSQTLSGMTSTLKDNLAVISGELAKGAFEKLKSLMEAAMPIIERFSATLKDEGLRAALTELFGKDKVDMAYELFNTIKDVGVTTFNLFRDAVKFVTNNLNILIPAVTGLTAAILAQMVINGLTKAYQLWRAATATQTTAQWLLNAALNANPLGIVALAVGVLVAAGVALYKNWDTVKEKTRQLWDKLGAFQGVATLVLGPLGFIIRAAVTMAEQWDSTKSVWENVWNAIKRTAANSVNEVIGSINALIEKINKIPGVNIPIIAKVDWGQTTPPAGLKLSGKNSKQAYATGTNFAPGGLALVGERGPELVHLPRGSKVTTARETRGQLGNNTTYGDIYVTIDGKNFEQMTTIVEFFKNINQVARQHGEKLPNYMQVKI